MSETLAGLVARFGYFAVFAAVFLESAGVPVPGETLLLTGAFFAHRGLLSLTWVIVVAALAATLGDNLGYLVGHRGGRPFVERHGARFGLTPARLAAIDALFARHGARAVFLARFVTGVRVFAAVAAGVAAVPWPRFLVWNAAGAAAWSLAVGLAGYAFGQTAVAVERALGRAGIFALGAIAALTVSWLAWRHGRRLVTLVAGWLPAGLTVRELVLVLGNAVAVAMFAKIAEDVVQREATRFDETAALAVHRLSAPALDAVMRALTTLGSAPTLMVVVLAVAVWALRRGDRRAAAILAGVAAVDTMLNALLKLAFHRNRPSLWTMVAALQSYSFPSGHAMGAVAVYGLTAVVVARLAPAWRPLLAVATPLFVFGIGLSRVYLGVHWPTDVLAGFAAGSVLLLAGIYLMGGPGLSRTGSGLDVSPQRDERDLPPH